MPRLFGVGQAGQQIQRSLALAGGGNVVFFAFDGFDGNTGDCADIDLVPGDDEFVLGDLTFLKDAMHRGQIKFRSHVHDRKIFVIEPVVGIVIGRFFAGHAHDLIIERLGMAIGIH